jgi:ferredoxin/flavodoxin
MLKNDRILCYYFSGTGNTLSLVERFAHTVKREGYEIDLKQMDRDPYAEPEGDFTLGLAFPVAIQSTFPLVWEFVENLPNGRGRDVFMFDTMESFSGGIVGPLKKVLTRKGYSCLAAREFRMSSSLNTSPGKLKRGYEKNRTALEGVERFAMDLITGGGKWHRVPLLSGWMRSISLSRKIWTGNSERISISASCIRCLKCRKGCPVGAVEKFSGDMVINHSLCISCMRCASNCPVQAFLFNGKELLLANSR